MSAVVETTLIDQLLADQNQLQTPVANFAENHDAKAPDLEPHYKTLIPLSRPGSGEQYAFEVQLDKCTGCKACVSACHSLNGLDADESWRDVGTIVGGSADTTYQQTITSACHHCESPECLHGCPVGAYDKDSETGIVRHLDDQCIGCSYCILKCPYDVPKYNEKRGIVRKCDMCHDRLAEGEAPACVQACPTKAISIVTVKKTSPAKLSDLPAIFPSGAFDLTKPTTRYVGREVPDTARPVDQPALKPEHAHSPLIGMLTLTQIGCGFLLTACLLSSAFLPATIGTALVFAGLGIGALHLGQPLKVWRFFLGLRTSWLSREFLLFGALTAVAPALVAITSPWTPDFPYREMVTLFLKASVFTLSLLSVFTSVMLYADTGRQLWSLSRTSVRFFATTFASALTAHSIFASSMTSAALAGLVLFIKVLSEFQFQKKAKEASWSPDQHSARLQTGPLKRLNSSRFITALVAVIILPVSPIAGLILLAVSEVLERTLFFTTVHAPRMVA